MKRVLKRVTVMGKNEGNYTSLAEGLVLFSRISSLVSEIFLQLTSLRIRKASYTGKTTCVVCGRPLPGKMICKRQSCLQECLGSTIDLSLTNGLRNQSSIQPENVLRKDANAS